MKKILIAMTVFLAVLMARDASALVNVEGRYWFTDLSGTVTSSMAGLPGTELNLSKDLGVKGSKGFPEVRVGFNFFSNRIRYAFVPMKWSGSTTISQTFNFNGQSFSAGDRISSEMRAYYHRLGYEYDFIDTLGNRLGTIVELKYFDVEATVNDSTTGIKKSKSIGLPVPTIGIAGRVSLPIMFSFGGEVTGISLGSTAYVLDGEASVDYKPVPFVSVTGGYRALILHLDHSNSRANVTVKGPFVGLKAEF